METILSTAPGSVFPADSPPTCSSSPLASRWEMLRCRVVHLHIPHAALNTHIPYTQVPTHMERAAGETSGWQILYISGACNVLSPFIETGGEERWCMDGCSAGFLHCLTCRQTHYTKNKLEIRKCIVWKCCLLKEYFVFRAFFSKSVHSKSTQLLKNKLRLSEQSTAVDKMMWAEFLSIKVIILENAVIFC